MALPHSFSTSEYRGLWLPFDGDRMSLRATIQRHLRAEAKDPLGILQVGDDGPRWVGGKSLELSYSHTDGAALLVYTLTARIGVDTERSDRKLSQSPQKMAARFFHRSEAKRVRDGDQFFELWCQKEAYGKWTREGLRTALSREMSAISPVRLSRVPVTPLGYVGWVAIG